MPAGEHVLDGGSVVDVGVPLPVSQERFKRLRKLGALVRPKLWMPFCSRLLVAESSKNILISPVLERLVRAGSA